ncbi:MAG: hypothetical protein ABFS86_20920 [Planctomycetota bacterium]
MFEEWQYDQLQAIAECEGRSISALVRAIVSQHLERRSKAALKALEELDGIGEGPPDLGLNHDRYLYGEE